MTGVLWCPTSPARTGAPPTPARVAPTSRPSAGDTCLAPAPEETGWTTANGATPQRGNPIDTRERAPAGLLLDDGKGRRCSSPAGTPSPPSWPISPVPLGRQAVAGTGAAATLGGPGAARCSITWGRARYARRAGSKGGRGALIRTTRQEPVAAPGPPAATQRWGRRSARDRAASRGRPGRARPAPALQRHHPGSAGRADRDQAVPASRGPEGKNGAGSPCAKRSRSLSTSTAKCGSWPCGPARCSKPDMRRPAIRCRPRRSSRRPRAES